MTDMKPPIDEAQRKKLRVGWSFGDGTQLHVGYLPYRKRPCVYEVDGSVLMILAFCRDEDSAARLAEYHAKLAAGSEES